MPESDRGSSESTPTPFQIPHLLTDEEAARYLGFKPQTLRVWRTKSRKVRRLIGPRWTEIGGGNGLKSRPRYRIEDLQAFAAAQMVAFVPRKRIGRPRKAEGAIVSVSY